MIIHDDITMVELLSRINEGIKRFYQICVEGGGLSGRSLEGIVFEECLLDLDFEDANLRDSKFINSNIKTCVFRNADLTNAIFDGNSVCVTNFTGAKIEGVTFRNNTYHSITLSQEDLQKMI